jgi:hypothetical protein
VGEMELKVKEPLMLTRVHWFNKDEVRNMARKFSGLLLEGNFRQQTYRIDARKALEEAEARQEEVLAMRG